MDLETPDPTTVGAVAGALLEPSSAPAPPAPPEEPTTPEAVITDEQKAGLLRALSAEREKSKALKAKAENFDQASGYLEALRPQLEYLRAHPEVMYQATQPEPPAPPATNPKHVALAQKLDLFTRDGQPDVTRAAEVMAIIEETSQSIAQRELQPMRSQTAREKAIANFNQVSTLPGINHEQLKQLWNVTSQQPGGMEMLADPNIAYVYAAAVRGHEQLQTPVPPAPGAPPLITESAGDRSTPLTRQPPTDLQQRVMALRGIDSKRYAELTKDFKPGVTNELE